MMFILFRINVYSMIAHSSIPSLGSNQIFLVYSKNLEMSDIPQLALFVISQVNNIKMVSFYLSFKNVIQVEIHHLLLVS